MQYPLELSFKILALAPQISVTDASGRQVFYVKQKLLKLKEAVTVFADSGQTQPLYKINADRVIDFSARYHFADVNGVAWGSVKREGVRSLWKSHYEIFSGSTPVMTIREENAWVKVLDGIFGGIPIIGMFSGYVFNPAFLVSRLDGTVVMRLAKQPGFFESKFIISKQAEMNESQEVRALLSLLMMILLERARG
ncbi:MAG: hypothetical protein GY832_38745 [Chloroflexi bacterium]|nr:hypothetical protein [Chloroflexota bacterium]